MKQILRLPEIRYVNYDVIYRTGNESQRLKIKCYGNIREDVITCIHNSIFFLPNRFKTYVNVIESFEIRKANGSSNGVFDQKDYSIKLYDRNIKDESYYSEVFLHELGHLIFDQYDEISSKMERDGNNNPIKNFMDGIKNQRIQPISEYLSDLQICVNSKIKNKYNRFNEWDYITEIFAGYFGFTYSRYCNPFAVKGSFTNYIKLRNLFWTLLDEIDDDDYG